MEGDPIPVVLYGHSRHFNPLPPHGGRRRMIRKILGILGISIHSLRMEGDTRRPYTRTHRQDFNPLPPHGGRPTHLRSAPRCKKFQSTPSAWRETSIVLFWVAVLWHFNPLPPHGGRLHLVKVSLYGRLISIHSLRMEGDDYKWDNESRELTFQSTPSAWRETFGSLPFFISCKNFNPLPPHGGRLRISQ